MGARATSAARPRELGSALLRADARHTQSDLYASVAVVASFVAARAGIGWADGVATLLLVALIGHAAWEVFHENVPVLIDAAMLDPGQRRRPRRARWRAAGQSIACDRAACAARWSWTCTSRSRRT